MATGLVEQKRATLKTHLTSKGMLANLRNALPKHMTPDRMVRVALTAISQTPKLLDCTFESLGLALLKASQLGVEPNGRDAHLVPYGTKCELITDYRGYIQLAYRSGQIDNISAKGVYENDTFEYELGTNEHLKHIPSEEENPGALRLAWAMVRFKDSGSKFVVLNARDIAKRRAMSKSNTRTDSPWNLWTEQMWAKSAVRELAKWMPQIPELVESRFFKATEYQAPSERDHDDLLSIDVVSEEVSQRADQLAAEMQADTAKTEQPEAPDSSAALSAEQLELSAMREDEFKQAINASESLKEILEYEKKAAADAVVSAAALTRIKQHAKERRENLKPK